MVICDLLSICFTVAFLLELIFSVWMERLNNRYSGRVGNQVPASFRGFISGQKLAEANAYQLDKSRLFIASKIVTNLTLLIIILAGLLPNADAYSINPEIHYIWAGLIFFVGIGILFFVLELPFDYYDTFVFEENTVSTRLI